MILVVEDSRTVAKFLSLKIQQRIDVPIVQVRCYQEAKAFLSRRETSVDLALVDLHLPDAPDGEILDLMDEFDVACLIWAGDNETAARELVQNGRAVDYLTKHNIHELDYIARLIHRIVKNRELEVLVVDDSRTARSHVRRLLENQRFIVREAAGGKEALAILMGEHNIRLVVVDYFMPGMDGVTLITEIRRRFDRNQMAIIGLSGQGRGCVATRLLKSGANDFLFKPFMAEEFLCRVMQNLDFLEQLDKIRDAAYQDFLTGLYNRRYLFEAGQKLFLNAQRGNMGLTVAIIDVDHFKHINDSLGHDAGDLVLKEIGSLLKSNLRGADLVARYGGEEFCVIAANLHEADAMRVFDKLRAQIERTVFKLGAVERHVQVSIGLCSHLEKSLTCMIKQADLNLYYAKTNGRNQVVLHRPNLAGVVT